MRLTHVPSISDKSAKETFPRIQQWMSPIRKNDVNDSIQMETAF